MNDLKFATRQLLKNPGFTTVAVLTLAVGIGANTAIFSVVDAVLLKALPYREPSRLVMLWTDNPSLNLGVHELPPAPTDLLEWRQQARSFEQIGAFRSRPADLSEQGEPERIGGVQITANFFSLLGVQPMLGRGFAPEEEELGKDKVALISYPLWLQRFGGDSNVLGQTITLDHERHSIIGVMGPGFAFPRGAEMPAGYALMSRSDVWRPYTGRPEYWRDDDTRDFIAMGRLKPGVTLAQAQTEMTALAQHEAEAYPKSHAGWTVELRPLARQTAGQTRSVLWVLLGAVGFVLLIACANVANLLLCRSVARRKEMAVRAAIGASRGHLFRQLLAESAVLSALGGALGLVLGVWGVKALLAFSPSTLPRLHETTLDARVFVFSFVLAAVTGILFGLAPAWQATRVNLCEALQSDSRSGTAARGQRAQRLLIIGEIALAVILLTGAGLLGRSLLRLQTVDLGFQPQQLAAFDVKLTGARYSDMARVRQFFREARRRLGEVPGARGAAAISNLPLDGVESLNFVFAEGSTPAAAGRSPLAEFRKISPGYFDTLGAPLRRGRDFVDQDAPDQPNVCVVNESLVRMFYPNTDPIGKRLKMARSDEPDHQWFTIVGVIGDVRSFGVDLKPRPQIYTTVEQNTDNAMTLLVRAQGGSAGGLEGAIRAELKRLDPTLPLANFRTMERLVSGSLARPRFSTMLLGLFAAAALGLAAVGLYGVVAYSTAQRTREIGIRMALGASAQSVLTLVLRQGMLPAFIGLALGLAGAMMLTRLLSSQLYEVRATDPFTFLVVGTTLLVVAVAACVLPACRAAHVDPIVALRYE
jgi:putative ABC transport system permease protein